MKEILSWESLVPRLAFRPVHTFGNGILFEEQECGNGSSGLAEPCFMSCLHEMLCGLRLWGKLICLSTPMPACTPYVKKKKADPKCDFSISLWGRSQKKNTTPKGQKGRERKDSKYSASLQLHLISRCCDLVAFLLWPDVRNSVVKPLCSALAGCFSWQQKEPAWHCHQQPGAAEGWQQKAGDPHAHACKHGS